MTRPADPRRAALQAYRCLMKLQITELPVRPLAILRRCKNTVVYTFAKAAEALGMEDESFACCYSATDAFTLRRGSQYIVCYREGGNPARLNFTLAHELGHILLHHDAENAAEEMEADCFASHLLCPQIVVEGKTPEEVATMCYVSRSASAMLQKREKVSLPTEMEEALKAQFANGPA